MDNYLNYEKLERSDSGDYCNGYKSKRVNNSYGTMEIEVPQDHDCYAICGKKHYVSDIEVRRLIGKADRISVIVPVKLVKEAEDYKG